MESRTTEQWFIRAPAFAPGDSVPEGVFWVGDAIAAVGVAGDPVVPSLLSMTASVKNSGWEVERSCRSLCSVVVKSCRKQGYQSPARLIDLHVHKS